MTFVLLVLVKTYRADTFVARQTKVLLLNLMLLAETILIVLELLMHEIFDCPSMHILKLLHTLVALWAFASLHFGYTVLAE